MRDFLNMFLVTAAIFMYSALLCSADDAKAPAPIGSFKGDEASGSVKPFNNEMPFDKGFTMEARICPDRYWTKYNGDRPAVGNSQIIAAMIDKDKNTLCSLELLNGQIVFNIHGREMQTVATVYNKNFLVPLKEWTNVAAVYDGENISIYINGQKELVNPADMRSLPKAAFVSLGGSVNYKLNTTPFSGKIDDVNIYDKPRTYTPAMFGFVANPNGAFLKTSEILSEPTTPLKTEVKQYNGIPTLFINGKPEPTLICREQTRPQNKTGYLKEFSECGVNLFIYSVDIQSFHQARKKYSSAEEFYEKYIFGQFNAAVLSKVAKDVPDAKFIIQIMTNTKVKNRPEWCEAHPEEIALWPRTEAAMKGSDAAASTGKIRGDRVSLCSELWKEETVTSIKALITCLRKSPFADRIAGYFFCGPPSEWGDYWDYSKPAQDAFKKWARDKYNNDLNKLRKAWNNKNITFETISIPEMKELYQGNVGIFYDPRTGQRLIDYLDYYHDMARAAISEFAKAAKEVSRDTMVGTWGYALFYPGWHMNDGEGIQNSRKTQHFDKLSKDPNIDFFILCHNYRERHPGGIYCPQFMPDNIILNGKLAINEDDTRTFLSTSGHPEFKMAESIGDNFGQAQSKEDTLAVLKRNFAGIFTKPGGGIAWYSIAGPPGMAFNHPDIFKTIKTFSEVSHDLLGKDKKCSQIAVIFSEESLYYQKMNMLYDDFAARAMEDMQRIGAPVDCYFAEDLLHKDFPFGNYKLYIFANTFYLSDAQRKIINEKVKTENNTLLWIYASGLISDKDLSVDNASGMTGIDMQIGNAELAKGLEVVLTDYSNPVPAGLASDIRYGTRNPVSPLLWCNDKDAVVLGEALSTSLNIGTFRKPGLCIKKMNNWTSIWSGAPDLPPTLLRNIAKYAGVHIYSEYGDQVFASRRMIAVHTRYAAERTIKFPSPCSIYDPFRKEYLAKDTKSITVFMPARSTAFWVLE